MAWFDEGDRLINPPGPKEVLDLEKLTSEGGSITVMDFHVALALYETADNVEELRDLPQKLLYKLHTHVGESPSGDKRLSKGKLLERLEDAVRIYSRSLASWR